MRSSLAGLLALTAFAAACDSSRPSSPQTGARPAEAPAASAGSAGPAMAAKPAEGPSFTEALELARKTSRVKLDETVLLFPTYAWLSDDERSWELDVHGWIFEQEAGRGVRSVVVDELREKLKLREGSDQAQLFEKRTRAFLVDNERNKRIAVEMVGRPITLTASAEDGHFQGRARIPTSAVELGTDSIEMRVLLRPSDSRVFAARVALVPTEGVTIVSDIDDTIKVSNVRDRSDLLRRTFTLPFEPVPEMAAAYRRLLGKKGHLHFVSSSPWQLFEPVRDLVRAESFPPATYGLKRIRVKDTSLLHLLSDPEQTKPAAIEKLIARFQKRDFILVGDSGEKDPEVYGSLARKYPERVRLTLIRNVTDEPRDAARYEQAFAEVPADRWRVFEDASTIAPP